MESPTLTARRGLICATLQLGRVRNWTKLTSPCMSAEWMEGQPTSWSCFGHRLDGLLGVGRRHYALLRRWVSVVPACRHPAPPWRCQASACPPPRSSAAPQQAHIREAQHLANPTFVAGALRDSRQVAIR